MHHNMYYNIRYKMHGLALQVVALCMTHGRATTTPTQHIAVTGTATLRVPQGILLCF